MNNVMSINIIAKEVIIKSNPDNMQKFSTSNNIPIHMIIDEAISRLLILT